MSLMQSIFWAVVFLITIIGLSSTLVVPMWLADKYKQEWFGWLWVFIWILVLLTFNLYMVTNQQGAIMSFLVAFLLFLGGFAFGFGFAMCAVLLMFSRVHRLAASISKKLEGEESWG